MKIRPSTHNRDLLSQDCYSSFPISLPALIYLALAICPLRAAPVGLMVTSAEHTAARSWVAAKFEGTVSANPGTGSLEIPEQNGLRRPTSLDVRETFRKNSEPGGPLRIGHETYLKGLYTGSVTRLAVHLPRAGKTFEAIAALGQDWFGRGNNADHAFFTVETGRGEIARSGTVLGGTPGQPVRAALEGATDFFICVRSFDNAPIPPTSLWADARVMLEDGRTIWLSELPVEPLAGPPSTEPPFSFIYGGKSSSELLQGWAVERRSRPLDDLRTEHTCQYRDPVTGLLVRMTGVEYHDFPTVEWTVYFENNGNVDTPIIENINALDTRLERNGEGEFVLHHAKGSQTESNDYEPHATTLDAKQAKEFVSLGRPTDQDLCYFNVKWPGEGLIVALGWPGQWAASFTRDESRGLHLQAGQAHTHFKLHPGEQVRTPLVALQFWKGDSTRAQNIWRRWMLAHNSPHPGGNPLGPVLWSCYSSGNEEYAQIDEQKNLGAIERSLSAGIKLDYWEMDAGWYVNNGKWVNTGTWEPDPTRFPLGLRPMLNFAHSKGLKTHIWFEPERVTRGSWLWENHPEWLLTCPDSAAAKLQMADSRLLDLGNPAAYKWMVAMLDGYINQGIDVYRTDFNIDPLPFWQAADAAAPDRAGITENKYVVGFLGYFDELARRHPNLLIDNCASGGRRNDLETMRRSIPVTRSDYWAEPSGAQNLTYGLASWIPLYGTGTVAYDSYTNRSAWGPWPGIAWDLRKPGLDLATLRLITEECRSVGKYFYGDYYPLTPYSTANSVWMAWQFDRPDHGDGMVQVFRRSESAYETSVYRLNGLESDATYEIRNIDQPEVSRKTGRQLMDEGLRVTCPVAPAALIFTYTIVTDK